jgi:hypothetical protein
MHHSTTNSELSNAKYSVNGRFQRPAWTAAKSVGDSGEQLVAHVLKSIGLLVQQIPGDGNYDLDVTGRIEVKHDRRAASTGNFAIEISHRGRPSGIATSTASCWALLAGNELLLVSTIALRRLADPENYPRVACGENAVVVLVPVGDIRKISRCLVRGCGQ